MRRAPADRAVRRTKQNYTDRDPQSRSGSIFFALLRKSPHLPLTALLSGNVSPMLDALTDFFDRLENFLYQFTRCLCYNLFHGDAPHFRSFLQGLNKFYHERRVPAILICRSAPLGGRSPRLPADRGSLFLPELFYTNAYLGSCQVLLGEIKRRNRVAGVWCKL